MAMPTPKRADEIVPANANEAAVLGFCTALMANDMTKFAAIWTQDAVHEVGYVPDGVAPSFAGRDAIVADYRRMFLNRKLGRTVFTVKGLYPTTDPDCIIIEFHQHGEMINPDIVYENDYICVCHLRGGQIYHFRIYANPLVAQRILGSQMAKAETQPD